MSQYIRTMAAERFQNDVLSMFYSPINDENLPHPLTQAKITENGVECVENAKKVCQCCEKRNAIAGHEKS